MSDEALFEMIDGQQWVDTISGAVQPTVRNLFEAAGATGAAVKSALHGEWLGHPLHPVLTDIPVGAWTVAMAFDAVELATKTRRLRAGADAAIGIGLLGAVGSAITGITDWSETGGRGRRVGAIHGMLNLTATALYTASWLMRRKGGRRKAIAVSSTAFAIANASAYLGGHLVFREQIGVDVNALDGQDPVQMRQTSVPSEDAATFRDLPQ